MLGSTHMQQMKQGKHVKHESSPQKIMNKYSKSPVGGYEAQTIGPKTVSCKPVDKAPPCSFNMSPVNQNRENHQIMQISNVH